MNNVPTNPEEFKQALGELAMWHQQQAFEASQRNDRQSYEFHVWAGFLCQVGAIWTHRGMMQAGQTVMPTLPPTVPTGPRPDKYVSPNDQGYVYGAPGYPPLGPILYGVPR